MWNKIKLIFGSRKLLIINTHRYLYGGMFVMSKISSVYLNIDAFEITEVKSHCYANGRAQFKFNRNISNDRLYIHLKSKENKHMKLIYKDVEGKTQADTHIILTSINCNDGVITVNMEK